jgi:hypothetical protein
MSRKKPAPEAHPEAVTGVRVRAKGPHEHDGTPYLAGAEFSMSPEAAELAFARGDVEIIDSEDHHEPG